MSIDRYVKDEKGFRKYVELMETMPTAKRQSMMAAAKSEHPLFVETAEKYVISFDRICRLPDMELTEVLASPQLKPELIATAILSLEDAGLREKMLAQLPRNRLLLVNNELKDAQPPKPFDIGAARLQKIQTTRELEKAGKLESLQIPHFSRDHFRKAA